MKPVTHWLRMAVERLDEIEVPYALVGGMAVAVRAEPRFTKDVDLAIPVATDSDAESVARHFIQYGYAIAEEFDQESTGRLATLRLSPPGIEPAEAELKRQPVIDLLFATCGIEVEIVKSARPFEIEPGLTVPVALTPHLIAMKLFSVSKVRTQDLEDLRHLIRVAKPADLKRARQLATLINQRNPKSRRNLPAALERYTKRWANVT